MTHMVFMKFEDGFFCDEVFDRIQEAYRSLAAALPETVTAVAVRKNCVERDTNMDLLIQVELDSKASLKTYLTHPKHRGIGEVMNPHVVNRCSFDWE